MNKNDPLDPMPTERPQTVLQVAEDGRTHRYGWDSEMKGYTIDLGLAYGPVEPQVMEETSLGNWDH